MFVRSLTSGTKRENSVSLAELRRFNYSSLIASASGRVSPVYLCFMGKALSKQLKEPLLSQLIWMHVEHHLQTIVFYSCIRLALPTA
ncbi:hypothetical protein TNCV_2361531 [Trichonephila clavipes]|nr:hypothetical protein TNCV_2361531 [Trichonephila clavipes]